MTTISIPADYAVWLADLTSRISADLSAAVPDMKGLSSSNLKYMKHFAQECPDWLFGRQTADQLSGSAGHQPGSMVFPGRAGARRSQANVLPSIDALEAELSPDVAGEGES